ncbi:hypothetical protein Q8A67_010233 [Cirrhinus molitorella]|uniref:Immunoglobulin domain-containing protein n=1 Tax=Cirrhinus molitorella TaxID=172907 RepID=A0AA88TP32_9TELE|nr:hypothetical protein Q8A67_010233 [Cirrhinus molitorella]
MTRTSLSALFLTFWITDLVSVYIKYPGISVWQKPEITVKEGTDVIITCHIKADSHKIKRIMVSPVFINMSLNLLSVRLNHSGMYYCIASMDLPVLGPSEYGNGTYVYVVPNLTTPRPVTMEGPANPIKDTAMWSLLLGVDFVLLISCIFCVILIHYKGNRRSEPGANKPLVNTTCGSSCPDSLKTTVVYAAHNIP